MSLAESQELFYDLCATTETLAGLEQDAEQVLQNYFSSDSDREFLARCPAERFRVYRNHVAIGFLGGIADVFPVIRSLTSLTEWNDLLNDFYLNRLSQSPLARRVFDEFAEYLRKYEGPLLERLPYLHELAEYERLGLQLVFALDIPLDFNNITSPPEDPLEVIPILNPHLELRVYAWPVHQISKDFCAEPDVQRGEYPLIVFRHPETLRSIFVEGNRLFSDMIEAIRPGTQTIRQVLTKLISIHKIPATQEAPFLQEGVQTLANLRQKGIIVGMTHPTRSNS